MVDFVLALDLRSGSELDTAIRNKLDSSALVSAHLCVNQTDYYTLMRSPAAVTIVSKVSRASLEEGRVQLGV